MIFFTDENVSHQAARLLEAFDPSHEIRAHKDRFVPGTPDVEWIREVADDEPKPIFVAGDGRILRNKVERRVLRECDLNFVVLAKGWTNLPWNDFAWKIVKAWPKIVDDVGKARRPSVLEVSCSTLKVKLIGRTASL